MLCREEHRLTQGCMCRPHSTPTLRGTTQLDKAYLRLVASYFIKPWAVEAVAWTPAKQRA